MKKLIEIHAYVDQLIDNEDGQYDKLGSCWFLVPEEWAEKMALAQGYEKLDHFLVEYIYDEVDGWLNQAIKDGVLEGCGTGIVMPGGGDLNEQK